MDKEPEDLQSLSFLGIIKEPFKLILRHAKLFASLTLTLILPLCFIILAHNLVTEPLIHKIHHHEDIVSEQQGTGFAAKTQKELNLERIKLLAIFSGYMVFVLAFSLLSTAAVVYSVASIYSGRALSYFNVLKVVPRVWKRLLLTFIWAFLVMFTYEVLGVFCIVLAAVAIGQTNIQFLFFLFLFLSVTTFCVGFIYLNCIWQLASVISVLEESFGFMAMRKSFHLIKGMRIVAFFLFLIYLIFTLFIGAFFNILVVHSSAGSLPRAWYGILFILLFSFVNLLGMLVQTVFYFACKSHHHESIDKLTLSEHLGAYLGEYVPLKSSIQMEPLEP